MKKSIKMEKKYGLRILLFCVFFCGSCMPIRIIKSTDCFYDAQVIGGDNRRCGCCGGWIVDVDGHTYLADSIPNANEIMGKPEDRVFPIPVYLNYVKAFSCTDTRIIITCIKKK
jgi:hypothetical protein